ncbi:MAG TPA: VOC family protein [Xanthobacteraceae bacterium]|jgi:2,3-dihydroxy-p-cumate/2,3-dihydroxybenzoate 3,4-dioxygenase
MTIVLEQLRYVRLGTRNLPEAARFAAEILGLQQVGEGAGNAYFRSDFRDFTLLLFEGDPAEQSVAFDVRTADDLDAAERELRAAGYPVRRGGNTECEERKVKAFLAFRDASGNTIEIVWRAMMTGWRYFPSRDTGVTGLQCIALRSTNATADERLWTKLFSGRVSDWVGDAAYIRLDPLHHRVALHPSERAGILSITYAVEGIDQIMQNHYHLRDSQVRIVHGPGRSPASNQIFLTFEGPSGVLFNLGAEMNSLPDNHSARQFPHAPRSFCSWGTECALPEFGGSSG